VIQRRETLLLRQPRPPLWAGIGASILAVAAITALIYPLREVMPEVSTGVLYLVAVLGLSTYWGLGIGLFTSVLAAAAFNFFHIPPTGQFSIAEPQNWVALGVFLAAAALASWVAGLARTRAAEADARRREAELATEMARLLLGGSSPESALEATAARLAAALGLDWALIELTGAPAAASPAGGTRFDLRFEGRRVGALEVPADTDESALRRLRDRIMPSLETLLAAALERHRLQVEVVEADALRRSDEIKTALLRSVSHDLRTPLTAIVAGGDALGSAALGPDERAELAAAVTSEASRLSRMVDQLLDLSRLEAGAAEPHRDWTSVDETARAAIDQVHPTARVKLFVDEETPLIRVDAAQLERALANVLDNAVRHSGGKPVSVRARPVGSRLMIRVVDQGPGIPEQELERIFEPFYRSNGDTGTGGGSGLGLAIARGFVEANGGRIRAESLPAQGSVIVIELPIEPLPESSAVDHSPAERR
jgi:two-component system sensor histidine kinase KdpD